MAMNGQDAAAAIMAAMDSDGVFDMIEDTDQRNATRVGVQGGLERHCVALIEYIRQNADVIFPTGVPVISTSTQVQIGVVAFGSEKGGVE